MRCASRLRFGTSPRYLSAEPTCSATSRHWVAAISSLIGVCGSTAVGILPAVYSPFLFSGGIIVGCVGGIIIAWAGAGHNLFVKVPV